MAAILTIKANFILVGSISKNHRRHHSSCHYYQRCFTTLLFVVTIFIVVRKKGFPNINHWWLRPFVN